MYINFLTLFTANILTAKNTTFHGVMILPVLPMPFGHLHILSQVQWINSPAVAFLEIIFYIIQTVVFTLNQCKNISKHTNFPCVMISLTHLQCCSRLLV